MTSLDSEAVEVSCHPKMDETHAQAKRGIRFEWVLADMSASVLLWKQQIESREQLERWQTGPAVIDGSLRLD